MNDDIPKVKSPTGAGKPVDAHAATDDGAMAFGQFDELDAILDDLRTRNDETPQWEFCEGFMAALICCRRVIGAGEYLPVLLDIDLQGGAMVMASQVEISAPADFDDLRGGSFANEAQLQRFMELWIQRWNEVAEALNAPVETLDDERAYFPEVLDLKGAVAELSPEARAAMPVGDVPSYAQVWAVGFMCVVESWPQEWAPPRDKKLRQHLDDALSAIIALTDYDTDEPTESLVEEDDGSPTVSKRRLNEFIDAIWAVYSLRDIWRDVGAHVPPAHAEIKPGRNDPCFCGSGKKYKKCHGA